MSEPNLCNITLGRITAAAGHGKTQLIALSLLSHDDPLPVLVLTHTNAGVHSLRKRLRQLDVPSSSYCLETIDAFMLRLAHLFPTRSDNHGDPRNGQLNYPALRQSALQLVTNQHLDSILPANYARLFVDEYQDCVEAQHRFVKHLSRLMPTCVLGDPLQAVFGFAGRLALWNEVGEHFDEHIELDVPWRWRNAENDVLGVWLLDVRRKLLAGEPIDLSTSPDCVQVIITAADAQRHGTQIEAARCRQRERQQSVLVIGDARNEQSRLNIARQVYGLTPIEPVDHSRSLIPFMNALNLASAELTTHVIHFAATIMVGVNAAETCRRMPTLQSGRNRRAASAIEQSALNLANNPTYRNVRSVLLTCQSAPNVRAYRPQVLDLAIHALDELIDNSELTPSEAGRRSRERARHRPRRLPICGIGSTLLLKGLECDHAVILSAESLSQKDLYVALTRGKLTITICTASNTLRPQ